MSFWAPSATGTTSPRIRNIRLAISMAFSKLPCWSSNPERMILPKDWPSNRPSLKRKSKRSRVSGASLSATRHWRASPGGNTPNSSRNTPVEPPSSHILTTAVISGVNSFNDCKIVNVPVPPPITTNFRGVGIVRLRLLPVVLI